MYFLGLFGLKIFITWLHTDYLLRNIERAALAVSPLFDLSVAHEHASKNFSLKT